MGEGDKNSTTTESITHDTKSDQLHYSAFGGKKLYRASSKCKQLESPNNNQHESFWTKYFRSINRSEYHNIRLKDLRVVLTPIMLKISKDGAVKVVQKRLNMVGKIAKKPAITTNIPKEKLIKQLFMKSLNDKSNTYLKAVVNNTVKKYNAKKSVVNNRQNNTNAPRSSITQPVSVVNKIPTKRKRINSESMEPNLLNNKRIKIETTQCTAQDSSKAFSINVKPVSSNKQKKRKNLFIDSKNQRKIDQLFNISKPTNNTCCTSIPLISTTKYNNNNVNFNTVNVKKLKQTTLFDVFNNKSTAIISEPVNGIFKYIKSKKKDKSRQKKKRLDSDELPLNNLYAKYKNTSDVDCVATRLTNKNSVQPPLFSTEMNELCPDNLKSEVHRNEVNMIFVHETNIIEINKYYDATHLRMNSAVFNAVSKLQNSDNSSFISDLFITLDFPCNKLNSLMHPDCVKFTTFPLSQALFDKVISSCIKVEIKKHYLLNQNDYYQFFIFKNDLPVLRISVCLNCKDQNKFTEDKVGNSPVNFSCLNNSFNLNGSITENLGPLRNIDVNTLNSSGHERRVCYSFDNEHNLNDQQLDDESSFFILPSLMHFNSLAVGSDKTCLQLLLKVVKISKTQNVPKSCIFKTNLDDSNLAVNSLNSNINMSCNKSITKTSSFLTPQDHHKPNSKDLMRRENKRSNILNEIQNKLSDTKRGRPRKSKGASSNVKNNNVQKTESTISIDVKLKTSRKHDSERSSILNTGIRIKNKYKRRESSKRKTMKNVLKKNPVALSTNIDKVGVLAPLDVQLEQNVTSDRYKTENEGDNKLFNYIKNIGENYITMVTGNNYKPSLIERMITSFKN